MMTEGAALVVSPLIALQKDQVDSINSQNTADAVVINSTQRASDTREAKEKIEKEAANTFSSHLSSFANKKPWKHSRKLESHSLWWTKHTVSANGVTISVPITFSWDQQSNGLGHPVVLAMTATASPEVRQEIVQRLGMRDPKIFVRGFDRPNIFLRVDRFPNESEKMQALAHRVRWADKPGIVYVATRKNAEEIMRLLGEEGVEALFYHGGLKASDREDIQERFMSGRAEVIVATNAFGMGVDKADVRFVYHYDVSDSLDSYYQEIGRAGRDGEKAEAVLFFRQEDLGVQKFRAGEGKLEPEQIEQVADVISDQEGPVEPEEIADKTALSERKLATVIHRLEDVGALEVLPTGRSNWLNRRT